MSAPAGRASLGAALRTTRRDRHGVLRAQLDETGRAPAWLMERAHETIDRDRRLDALWARTGPGRRDRWAAAIARDLDKRDRVGGMSMTVDGVEIELTGGSAAEIVGREPFPVLVPPPPGLLQGMAVEIERAVRDAEQVLGGQP